MISNEEINELKNLSEFSRYLGRLLENKNFSKWLIQGGLQKSYLLIELYRELKKDVYHLNELNEIKRAFRKFKQLHFLRLGAREFLGKIQFQDLVAQISYIAEVCLQVGIEILFSKPNLWLKDKDIINQRDCNFCVLGLGKLGGKELNYASDIDLIYIYQAKTSSVSCSYYIYLAQYLNSIIGDMFEGDRVFN